MIAAQRRAMILEHLRREGGDSIIELAASIGVSASTIRRDLDFLMQGGYIVRSHGGATKWIDFDNAKYAYVAQVGWSKNAPPTFYALDRAQRNGLVFSVDPATGKASELVHEHDDAWLNVDASCPRWLEDGSAFLWSTEKNGAWELELHDKKGALVRTVVPKNDGYRELSAVDSEKKVVVVDGPDRNLEGHLPEGVEILAPFPTVARPPPPPRRR